MSKADLSKKPKQVAEMFDQVASRYDFTNTVLSFGNDKLWRIATRRALAPRPGDKILDLAAGTGTSSASLASTGATVIAADFSSGMLDVGRRKYAHIRRMSFAEADATNLPFDDNEFDAVTISFGLRNVIEPRLALKEMLRVTRPGGRVVVCEFSTPATLALRSFYRLYLNRVSPLLVKFASSNPTAYEYLNESISAWPRQAVLASWMTDTGWSEVAYRNLTGGIVALHRGTAPSE